MEEGRWIEIAGGPGGEPTGVAGRYAAHWRRDEGAWVIHAELFVTLGADQGG